LAAGGMNAIMAEGGEVAHPYCSMMTEMCKAEGMYISHGEPESLQMVEVLINLTASRNVNVAMMAMEFFLELQVNK